MTRDAQMTTTPQPGEQIGSYRIDSLLTQGGMAAIFRGTDVHTGRPVAIKIPHPEMRNGRPVLRSLSPRGGNRPEAGSSRRGESAAR